MVVIVVVNRMGKYKFFKYAKHMFGGIIIVQGGYLCQRKEKTEKVHGEQR